MTNSKHATDPTAFFMNVIAAVDFETKIFIFEIFLEHEIALLNEKILEIW